MTFEVESDPNEWTYESHDRIVEVTSQENTHEGWAINCPGCGQVHFFDKRWTFNGDYDYPTFSPSHRIFHYINKDGSIATTGCHITITNGVVKFHDDCNHDLAGKVMEFEKFPNV